MYVLGGLDESFDSIFATVKEKMLKEKITIDDAKALILSHESTLKRRKTTLISPLPTINVATKIDSVMKT